MDSKQAAAIVTACVNEKSADALQKLTESECLAAVSACREELSRESSLLELDGGITVTGLVRGEFDSLLQILEAVGPLGKARILFLGNYTAPANDRSCALNPGKRDNSIECLLFLILLKVAFPSNVWLLRGGRENKLISVYVGLDKLVRARYSITLWRSLSVNFHEMLPCAAVVASRVFCAAGGISPRSEPKGLLSAIAAVERPVCSSDDNLPCDTASAEYDDEWERGWEPRLEDVSFCFGPPELEEFLQVNSLDSMVTSSMLCEGAAECFTSRRVWRVRTSVRFEGMEVLPGPGGAHIDDDGKVSGFSL